MRKGLLGILMIGLIGIADMVDAGVPREISYQGKLLDKNGVPVTGKVDIEIKVYDSETDGNEVWRESHYDVQVKNGLFSIILNPPVLFEHDRVKFDKQYWLEIYVDGEKMDKRQKLTSVGYAITAGSLQGDKVVVDETGNVGIGTTNPGAKLDVTGEVGNPGSGSETLYGIRSTIINDGGGSDTLYGLYVAPTKTGGGSNTIYGLRVEPSYSGGGGSNTLYGLYVDPSISGGGGSNVIYSAIFMNGNVGIGTTNPDEKLEVEGKVKAREFITGDITFQKDGKALWRMFEGEDGLYLESLKTGKVYRFVLQEVEK
jgi:hypothetical protein